LREDIRRGFGDNTGVGAALAGFSEGIGVTEIRGAQRPLEPFVAPVPEKVLDREISQLIINLMGLATTNEATTHICEKTPSNAQFALLIERWCPDARVVVMLRDAVDVALSHTTRSWGPADPGHAALYTRDYFDRWEIVGATCTIAKEVEHSHLVQQPAAIVADVLGFVGAAHANEPLSMARNVVRAPASRRRDQPPDLLARMTTTLSIARD
jgi:hypothetical protein